MSVEIDMIDFQNYLENINAINHGGSLSNIPKKDRTLEICIIAVHNNYVELKYVPKKIINQKLCLLAVKQNGNAIKYIPEALKTSELYFLAVKYDWSLLEEVPEELRTPEMCQEAVKQNGIALKYVPEALKTQALCLKAVKNGGSLDLVPEEFKTPELCLEAVSKHPFALCSVPEKLKTSELCQAAVKRYGPALACVPEALKTQALCLEGVTQGCSLESVPEEFKTPELCLVAVKSDYTSLKFIPQELKTSKLCLEAVKNNWSGFFDVPENLMTLEICFETVKQRGDMLEHIPKEMRTLEICLEAVRQNGEALKNVPKKIRTKEMCLEALKGGDFYGGVEKTIKNIPNELRTSEIYIEAIKNGYDLVCIPEELITSEICMEAVKRRPGELAWVPESLRTPELCWEAVCRDSYVFQWVPEALRTPELCLEAVRKGGALGWVPEVQRTPELCLEAVQQDGRALEFVPDALKTPELCLEAVQQDGRALEFVPDALKTPELCLEAVKCFGCAFKYVPGELKTSELGLEAVKGLGLHSECLAEVLKRLEGKMLERKDSPQSGVAAESGKLCFPERLQSQANAGAASLVEELCLALGTGGQGVVDTRSLCTFMLRLVFCCFLSSFNLLRPSMRNNFLQFSDCIRENTKDDGSDLKEFFNNLFWNLYSEVDFFSASGHYRYSNQPKWCYSINVRANKLFEIDINIPMFNKTLRDIVIKCAEYDWKNVSISIFKSIVQIYKHQENISNCIISNNTIENIIKPLFIDTINEQIDWISKFPNEISRKREAYKYFDELKNMRFLIPNTNSECFLQNVCRELDKISIKMSNIDPQLIINIVKTIRVIELDELYGMAIEAWLFFTAYLMAVKLYNRDSNEYNSFITNFSIHKGVVVCGDPMSTLWKWSEVKCGVKYDYPNAIMGIVEEENIVAWVKNAAKILKKVENSKAAFAVHLSFFGSKKATLLWKLFKQRNIDVFFAYVPFRRDKEEPYASVGLCAQEVKLYSGAMSKEKVLYREKEDGSLETIHCREVSSSLEPVDIV